MAADVGAIASGHHFLDLFVLGFVELVVFKVELRDEPFELVVAVRLDLHIFVNPNNLYHLESVATAINDGMVTGVDVQAGDIGVGLASTIESHFDGLGVFAHERCDIAFHVAAPFRLFRHIQNFHSVRKTLIPSILDCPRSTPLNPPIEFAMGEPTI